MKHFITVRYDETISNVFPYTTTYVPVSFLFLVYLLQS